MEPAERVIEWTQLREHPDYDIQTTYPFLIRKRSNHRIAKLTPNNGYLCCTLNRRLCKHHRIIALQFIPNPNNLTDIDHINHHRDDNHIENLRWVSHQDNARNMSSKNGRMFEFIHELPADAIAVEAWNGHRFEGLYYLGNGEFAVFNGIKFRVLTRSLSNRGIYYIRPHDIDQRQVKINIANYRISINDIPIAEPIEDD